MSKSIYKIQNWSSYNVGLKQRGSINLWISADIPNYWKWAGDPKRGGQHKYSAMAIELCLTVGKVYSLALRQTEGFIESFFKQCKWDLSVPCYTTLCRRSKGLTVSLGNKHSKNITDIVLDSTGLKVYGEGEWKVRKHGKSKYRLWMKMHLAMDERSQQIVAVKLTPNNIEDSAAGRSLIVTLPQSISSVTGDGAYDKHEFRKLLKSRGIRQVIPPQSNAVINGSDYLRERDAAIGTIAGIGRIKWKMRCGYHRRSKIETAMFRYKTIINDHMVAKKISHQQTEVEIGCKILNVMLKAAKPVSIKIN